MPISGAVAGLALLPRVDLVVAALVALAVVPARQREFSKIDTALARACEAQSLCCIFHMPHLGSFPLRRGTD